MEVNALVVARENSCDPAHPHILVEHEADSRLEVGETINLHDPPSVTDFLFCNPTY